MFDTLLFRLFRRPAPPVAQQPRPVRAAPTAERRVAASPPPAAVAGLGARRPLVSATGALAGFEFHVAPEALNRLRRRQDEPAANAYAANVLGAMRACSGQNLAALAALPASWLARCAGADLFVPGMHLLLLPDALFDDPAATAKLLDRLRRAGVRIGWQLAERADGRAAPTGAPDFIPVPAPAGGDALAWRAAVEATARTCPGVPQVLLELPGVDVMEAVLGPPVLFAASPTASGAAPSRLQALPPQAQRLLTLLNRLVRDDDNALLVNDIKADAALSLRLLHHLNSAGASPGRPLDSIEQAVQVLGRDALYRWVAQMLVRLSPPRPAAEALQAMALARARLLELLARAAQLPNPGSLYLLGLASMLPTLLQCSLEDAVEPMQLPPPAMQALRQHSGPWEPFLALLQALEAQQLARAEALAAPFGGLDAVLAHWTQAWLPK